MLKENLKKASKKALHIVKRSKAASAMMAVALGAAALSSCSYDNYVDSAGRSYTRRSFNLNSIGGGNGKSWVNVNGGGVGYWGGIPMYSGGGRCGAPRDVYLGRSKNGSRVYRTAYMLNMDAKDLVVKTDKDGNEWKVAKGTKLPKAFKVIVTEDKTIPVPAAQYDQITAAMNKGELNFVVDANGQYGLVPKAAVKDFKTATLTFEKVAEMARVNVATQTQGKGSR